MSPTWYSNTAPPRPPQVSISDWPRVAFRAVTLVVLVFGGLGILVLLRLIERPVFGLARPITPYINTFVCRNALRTLCLGFSTKGAPMQGKGAVVANHSSWLDIFVLNATQRIYFVSKSEVARWPGIGWLARATGTVFVERTSARARQQTELIQNRLRAGHQLLFFPEGTSSDGVQVLPFKTTLFQAFFDPELRHQVAVQPVSVVYHAPAQEDPRYYGWWGDMSLGPHLLAVLATARPGKVEVVYHDPFEVTDFTNRKELALACETQVREGHRRP